MNALVGLRSARPPGDMTRRVGAAGAAALALLASVVAQAQDKTATPRAVATSIAEPIHVDGILDEPAWSRAVPIGPLVQSDPKQGAPASEETEVRVLFDASTLYLGIACRDRDSKAIVATQLARDANLEVDDRVLVVLDPFFDHLNGLVFAVTPA